MINGIINVYKEPGYTSHDVVAKLRGILRQKKIGHTGTLDPMAKGVLAVCLGNATKLCDLITDHDKIYETELLLGVTTDTEDVTGTVLATSSQVVDEESIRKVVQSFVGEYDQIPPMYSAIRVNGKHLYELARKGKEVAREARRVEITALEILSIAYPVVRLRIACSKGTYIRSLCRDIGEKLGVGGCMQSLLRVKVGSFMLENAHTLEEIEKYQKAGNLDAILMPSDSVFAHLEAWHMRPEEDRYIRNGNPVQLASEAAKLRIYLSDGSFAAVYRYDASRQLYVAEKMFLTE